MLKNYFIFRKVFSIFKIVFRIFAKSYFYAYIRNIYFVFFWNVILKTRNNHSIQNNLLWIYEILIRKIENTKYLLRIYEITISYFERTVLLQIYEIKFRKYEITIANTFIRNTISNLQNIFNTCHLRGPYKISNIYFVFFYIHKIISNFPKLLFWIFWDLCSHFVKFAFVISSRAYTKF